MESSPLAALWGVFSNGEWSSKKGVPYTKPRPFDSPLRLDLQKGEQFVRRLELALAKAWRHDRLDSLQLLSRIGSNVDFRSGQITMPQPQRNFSNVFCCLQYDHCTGMPKHVGRDLFAA